MTWLCDLQYATLTKPVAILLFCKHSFKLKEQVNKKNRLLKRVSLLLIFVIPVNKVFISVICYPLFFSICEPFQKPPSTLYDPHRKHVNVPVVDTLNYYVAKVKKN